MNDRLLYSGVFIYAVAQRLDCREKTSRPLLTLHGMMDEQFLVSLGEKVHRGQEGRALKGMQPGGRCFGYRNVPIEDPTRMGKYGRAAVSGVKLEFDEEQAAIVLRVFNMYADGSSLATIAKTLMPRAYRLLSRPATGRYGHDIHRRSGRWCVTNVTGVFSSGIGRVKRGTRRPDARPADHALSLTGCGWRFLNGGSCPRNSGSELKLKSIE
jgi:hypothetical protein